MEHTNSILIFGAGKIGRSFIGQLFGQSGYEVVFVDVDHKIVDELNRKSSYPVVFKGEVDETIVVQNVRAVPATDYEKVKQEIAKTSIMAVSVGKTALEQIIPVIAEGLRLRQVSSPGRPLDIIIAENMRSAAGFIQSRLVKALPEEFPLADMVGLVETSIGKMVPLMTEEDLKDNPLTIFAEPYNELILDKHGFKGEIPNINGLSPKENMKAWVDCKAFIHNLGHALAAYAGNFYHPEADYIFEALADNNIMQITRKAMYQAAEILISYYPNDFSFDELEKHIDDLLFRFHNQHLKDTVYRVGQDLQRKMGIDDRFAGIIKMAEKKGLQYNFIVHGMAYGFFFRKADSQGIPNPMDVQLVKSVNETGVAKTLSAYCGFHLTHDKYLIESLNSEYLQLKKISSTRNH